MAHRLKRIEKGVMLLNNSSITKYVEEMQQISHAAVNPERTMFTYDNINASTHITEDELFDLTAPPLHKPVIVRLRPRTLLSHGIDIYQDDKNIILGRSKELVPPYRIEHAPKLSAKHCELRVDADTLSLFIRDLSSNGTFINGKRLPRKK